VKRFLAQKCWAHVFENGPAQVADVATNPPLEGTADDDYYYYLPIFIHGIASQPKFLNNYNYIIY
jgi:hypothetical protein